MPTDLAIFSDRLFVAALAVYVLAMVLHAVEMAMTKAARPAELVAAPAPVGAGSFGAVATADDPTSEGPAGRTRADRIGRMAVSLTVLGALLGAVSIVCRGIVAERWPLGNMYEFTSAICLVAVVTWLVVLWRAPSARMVGPFVLVPVLVLMIVGFRGLYTEAAPVQPSLQSYWLVIHVSTISISSGLLLVPGVASLLYLLRSAERQFAWAQKLPAAEVFDRLAYRVTIVAFPLFTFAVIAGAIWAESAWGRFWGWDPKETVAFVSWVVYAAYLHARATAGWRAARAAWINVLAFATMIFNLFFVNLVVAGLHSYAGVG